MVLGPRIGKYNKDGSPNAIPGHNIPFVVIGTLILVFGWMGFNPGSTLGATDLRIGVVAVNTLLAACIGFVIAMVLTDVKYGKPDVSMSCNGMLAGLVAITAPCAFVQPWAASVIGIVAGVIVVESVWFFEKRGVDDPVGAISVHGVCGAFGVLAVGLFADGSYGVGWNGSLANNTKGVTGIFYGGSGGGQLAAQAAGVLTIGIVMFGIAYAFFYIQNKVMKGGIRPTRAVELQGVDIPEMGVLAYPSFYGSNPHVEMPDHDGLIELPEPVPVGQETSR
jgi:Amt family ammonium transporter